jgi:hypothetical protein
MKSVYVNAAVFALTAVVNFSPALGKSEKLSDRNGASVRRPPPRLPSRQRGITNTLCGYDRHAAWRGRWVFLRRPAQTMCVRAPASDKFSTTGLDKQ